jgi:hypothetical protein
MLFGPMVALIDIATLLRIISVFDEPWPPSTVTPAGRLTVGAEPNPPPAIVTWAMFDPTVTIFGLMLSMCGVTLAPPPGPKPWLGHLSRMLSKGSKPLDCEVVEPTETPVWVP